jgi:hypothetical protein
VVIPSDFSNPIKATPLRCPRSTLTGHIHSHALVHPNLGQFGPSATFIHTKKSQNITPDVQNERTEAAKILRRRQ